MEEKRKKIVFIANPVSGTKNKKKIIRNIRELIDEDVFFYEIVYTEYAGHASEIAKKASESGADVVVAVGGDGTINEVARSLVHTDTALAIIPCGSGNGLARHLHIPMDSRKAIAVINKCNVEKLDYGKIDGHCFFCTCGMGFDAYISRKFAEAGTRGLSTYVKTTLKEWFRYKPDTYRFITESGEVESKAVLITCGNASQYGNDAYICPDATMKDGLMDITLLKPFSTLQSVLIALQMFTRKLSCNSHSVMLRSQKLHVVRSASGAIHCDGDPLEAGKEIDIEIIDKGLKVVTNVGFDY